MELSQSYGSAMQDAKDKQSSSSVLKAGPGLLMQLQIRRITSTVIGVEGNITLTSVSTKNLYVMSVKRLRSVTNTIKQGHANRHILKVHIILVLTLIKKLKIVYTQVYYTISQARSNSNHCGC